MVFTKTLLTLVSLCTARSCEARSDCAGPACEPCTASSASGLSATNKSASLPAIWSWNTATSLGNMKGIKGEGCILWLAKPHPPMPSSRGSSHQKKKPQKCKYSSFVDALVEVSSGYPHPLGTSFHLREEITNKVLSRKLRTLLRHELFVLLRPVCWLPLTQTAVSVCWSQPLLSWGQNSEKKWVSISRPVLWWPQLRSLVPTGTKCRVELRVDLALPAWHPLGGQWPKAVFPSAFPPLGPIFNENSQVHTLASEPKWFPGKLMTKIPV